MSVPPRRAPNIIPYTVVEGPEAWYVKDYADIGKHAYRFTEQDIAEIDAALAGIPDDKRIQARCCVGRLARGRPGVGLRCGSVTAASVPMVPAQDVTKADFSLPSLAPTLAALLKEATWGRGWALLQGLPVWRYTRRQSMLAFWLIGLHWGKAGSNNKKGERQHSSRCLLRAPCMQRR